MSTKNKTKPASAKAPKMKLEKELGTNAIHTATVALGEISTPILKDMYRLHSVPIAKYKDDMAERLAVHLIQTLGRKVLVRIF